MPQKTATLSYTTLNHDARRKLGLTWIEYGLIDSIFKLSMRTEAPYHGWCIASKKYLANFLGISEREAFKVIQKGINLQLIEKHPATKHLETTTVWFDVTQLSDTAQSADPTHKVQTTYAQNAHQRYAQSADNKVISNKEINTVTPSEDKQTFPAEHYTQVLDHLQAVQGIGPFTNYGPQRKVIKDAFLAGYTVEQIKSTISSMWEGWYGEHDKTFDMYKVAQKLPDLKRQTARPRDLPVSYDDLYEQSVAKQRAFQDDLDQKLAAARQRKEQS